MNSLEYNGHWWLPDNPQVQISGRLKFDPVNGGALELIGSFKGFQLNTVLDSKIILGFAEGKAITLYQCYDTGSKMNMSAGGPLSVTSSFIINVVFVGHHFEKAEDIVFKSLSVNYSHLAAWTGITGFKFAVRPNQENHLDQYDVSYKFPEKVAAKVKDAIISFDYNFHDGGDRIEEFRLKQTTFVKVEPPQALHFDDYLNNFYYHIQNFISLGVGKAVYPVAVRGKNENCKLQLKDEKVVYNDIDIFYQIRNSDEIDKKIHAFDMFFVFGDIKDGFEAYLNNWFNKAEMLQPVYDLYFAILYSPRMYLQHKFLSLTQALETYHRRIHGGKYVADNEYKPIYESLINAIPEKLDSDFKTSLKTRLKYDNEFSMRKRLKEILTKCNDILSPLIPDKKIFIDDVVNTRNFLTHYDKSLEGKEKNGKELYDLTEMMHFILDICFLEEIGIPGEKTKNLISRNKRYQYLTREKKP